MLSKFSMAVAALKAMIEEMRVQAEREAEIRELKGEHKEAGWGNQIRSYVLHPYQMVKDHRIGLDVGNVNSVLDGEIDVFIEGVLLSGKA